MSGDEDSFNDDEFDDYSDDGEGDQELEDVKSKLVLQQREAPFESFDFPAIRAHISHNVQRMTKDLNLRDENNGLVLYTAFDFNEKLASQAYRSSVEDTCRKVGLPTRDCPLEDLADKIIECESCLDDVLVENTRSLWCGHRFCRTCWDDYLSNFVHTQGAGRAVCGCLEAGCAATITRQTLRDWGIDSSIMEKLDEFLVKDFVLAKRATWKWCPGLNCDCAVELRQTSLLQEPVCIVTCGNSHRFCFKCGLEDHSPVRCHLLEQWLEKCSGESENAQWIIANTRKCPLCKCRIEKSHGCNHMVCPQCQYEFCWVCMGNWKEHGQLTGGFYKCNRYKKRNEMIMGPKTTEDENDLYLHFFNRYANHDASRRYAQKHRSELKRKMEVLQARNKALTWQDVQFLKEAGEVVERCRQILKHTYVFGYYLQLQKAPSKEIELFEFLQEQLERNTEYLHELTEQQLDAIDRQNITNYTRVTEKLAHKILEGIANGLTTR